MRFGNGLYGKDTKRLRQLGSYMEVRRALVTNTAGWLTDATDFEKTFIQAIVYNYDVLREYGTEADVKAAGKVLTKGKDYEMVSPIPS